MLSLIRASRYSNYFTTPRGLLTAASSNCVKIFSSLLDWAMVARSSSNATIIVYSWFVISVRKLGLTLPKASDVLPPSLTSAEKFLMHTWVIDTSSKEYPSLPLPVTANFYILNHILILSLCRSGGYLDNIPNVYRVIDVWIIDLIWSKVKTIFPDYFLSIWRQSFQYHPPNQPPKIISDY